MILALISLHMILTPNICPALYSLWQACNQLLCCHLSKGITWIPTYHQSQGPATKEGQVKALAYGTKDTISQCLSSCSHSWDFQIFFSPFFSPSSFFLCSITQFFGFSFSLLSSLFLSLHVLPLLGLPLPLQLPVTLCFLELKTHLLREKHIFVNCIKIIKNNNKNTLISQAKPDQAYYSQYILASKMQLSKTREVFFRISKACGVTIAEGLWFQVLPQVA